MRIYFILLCLSIFHVLSGCAYTTSRSKTHSLKIDFKKNNLQISKENISVIKGEVLNLEDFFEVKLLPVQGGKTYLFRRFVIKETDGDKYKGRLKINCNSVEYKFSVNEILKWPLNNALDSIYIAPKICE